MKIKKKWLVFGLILLFLLGAGIGILLKNPAAQQTAESAAVPVQSVAAVTGCLDKLDVRNRFLGMVLPMETVEIRLDEGRETGGLLVEPGSRVEAGAVLAIYDNTNLSLEREELILSKEQAELNVSSLETQRRSLEKSRREAQTKEERESLELQLLELKAQSEQASFEIRSKEREIAVLEQKLFQTQVTAPCAGIITAVGEDGKSLTLVSEGTYELTFSVSEEEVKSFSGGAAVTVTDRKGESGCEGIVSRVETGNPQENGGLSEYQVHAVLEGAEQFFPGQHVYAELKNEAGSVLDSQNSSAEKPSEPLSVTETILLPEGYISDLDGSPWVWAAGRDGRLEKRTVTLGAYNDRHSACEITGGLSITDYVAWPGANLREGQQADFGEEG